MVSASGKPSNLGQHQRSLPVQLLKTKLSNRLKQRGIIRRAKDTTMDAQLLQHTLKPSQPVSQTAAEHGPPTPLG